jgi:hypothetical protein
MQAARRVVADTASGGARSWGAYQHYGDPLYRLVAAQQTGVGRAKQKPAET